MAEAGQGAAQAPAGQASVHRDRRCSVSASAWVRGFACEDLKPLIICRGPVRKEAMDVFEQMGITGYGILLSDKDCVVHTNAVAPELRAMRDRAQVHRVADYTGADAAEREARIAEIIGIAQAHGYDSIFAGYGFMAEEEALVGALEQAGLAFIGPGAATVRAAGRKDVAKRTALAESISVTPGVDNVAALALLAKVDGAAGLAGLAAAHDLPAPPGGDVALAADALLDAGYKRGVDLVDADDILAAVRREVAQLLNRYPDRRLRLKAVGGGGGKGQRVLAPASTFPGGELAERIGAVAEDAAVRAREIWSEVKAMQPGANKNVLIELNVDANRHQEVQVLGNGNWCIALGLRDCSAQMHEQKLVETSVTEESLRREIAACREAGEEDTAEALETDLNILLEMEDEAARFGKAVGLDSVSTFECIVDGADHYFMEMNTRIQVEHRVTELCYALEFTNPDDPADALRVDSLIEAMTLIARHGAKLPRPRRAPRHADAIEVRLNATDAALRPAAGGSIEAWSNALAGEIRDDQGICAHNPDTDLFVPYYLAGAYDSNIALLLTTGDTRALAFDEMLEVLRRSRIKGRDLETNLDFHYGLLNWLAAQHPRAKIETRFVQAWLAAVARLHASAQDIDLDAAFSQAGRVLAEDGAVAAAYVRALALKSTLVLRPLRLLFKRPHALAGWAAASERHFDSADGEVRWRSNPFEVLAELYRFLDMDRREGPAAEAIWSHDRELLERALGFHARLAAGLSAKTFGDLHRLLRGRECPVGAPQAFAADWDALRASHAGFLHGLQLLALPRELGREAGLQRLRVRADLTVEVPQDLYGDEVFTSARRTLAPAPVAAENEIVAELGGMFYPREAPGMARFLEVGAHFDVGDTLYVIEVMKMFTKVTATFAGTVDECVLGEAEGVVVRPGDTLFRVTPDEPPQAVDAAKARQRRIDHTRRMADRCMAWNFA